MKKLAVNLIKKLLTIEANIKNPIGKELVEKKLSYLSTGALYNISLIIKSLEKENVPGKFLELGCALGGSTIQIGKSKSKNRMLQVYDVFGMIPEPSERDSKDIHERYEVIVSGNSEGIDNEKYYGYEEDLLAKVKDNLKQFDLSEEDNIELIQGLYEDTLKISEPIAFAHIDCDWYDSVMTCLTEIEPNLSIGGVMIIDDYYSWSGCKDAFDSYFDESKLKTVMLSKKYGKLIVKKIK